MTKGGNEMDVDRESYKELRDELIPAAVKHANRKCGSSAGKKKGDDWAAEWNRAFHERMNQLAREYFESLTLEWIVGADACRAYLRMASWKTAKRWIKQYNAPMRRWIDGRPVFIKSELDEWLRKTGMEIGKLPP